MRSLEVWTTMRSVCLIVASASVRNLSRGRTVTGECTHPSDDKQIIPGGSSPWAFKIGSTNLIY